MANLAHSMNRRDSVRRSTPTARAANTSAIWRTLLPVLALIAFLAAWQDVAQKAARVVADGTLIHHTARTLIEVLGGLALGLTVATILGYTLAKSVSLERALSPYLVALQAIPIVAFAWLVVLWFGPGLIGKILISALVVFFPILVNTIAGVRSVPDDLRDLMRSLHATPWQMFAKLEVPAALPILLAGLKVGATLSVIGAVVGEFTGSDAGLGVMISIADGQYDTARMFVGVFTLVALALSLYGLVSLIERRALAWRR